MSTNPHMFGDTYGSMASWRWDRHGMRFVAEHNDHEVIIHFHKVGGRWSRSFEDGKPDVHAARSYWTIEVDNDRDRTKYPTAEEAKVAAVAEYRRRFVKAPSVAKTIAKPRNHAAAIAKFQRAMAMLKEVLETDPALNIYIASANPHLLDGPSHDGRLARALRDNIIASAPSMRISSGDW